VNRPFTAALVGLCLGSVGASFVLGREIHSTIATHDVQRCRDARIIAVLAVGPDLVVNEQAVAYAASICPEFRSFH
jgi:hypothetical protein